jgi:pentatricopeptide repeat protein
VLRFCRYGRGGDFGTSWKIFEESCKKQQVDIVVVNNIIDACAFHGETKKVVWILQKMSEMFNLEPNENLFSSAIEAFSRNGKLKEVIQTLDLMEAKGFSLGFKDGRVILQLMAHEKIPESFKSSWSELKKVLGNGQDSTKLNLEFFREVLKSMEKFL